ncbi:hypothetical protein HHI36_019564, partial [Cryptolaemus montrouzieri]
HTLQSVSRHADLGLTVTNNLTWSEHTANVASKAWRTTYMLQQNFGGCEMRNAKVLYQTIWNRLPNSVVSADTVNLFKNRFDAWKETH